MSLTTSLSVTDILAAANSNENGSSSSDMWNCLNCLLDTSCEVLECKYCEAPKAFSDKKRQEIEEEKRKKVEALFVEEEKRDGLVGTGDSDDPIVLDEDPVIVLPSNTNEDVVDLISDDDNDVVEVSNTGSKRSSPNGVDGQGKKKIKLEFEPKKFGEANDPDGEVIEVLPPLEEEEEDMMEVQEIFGDKLSENVTDQGPMTCINADKDEDVVFISSNATMSRDMPHARHCCPIHIFQQGQIDSDPYDYFNYRVKRKFSVEDTTNNSKYCSNCYCYVCDVPAKSCSRWNTKISSSQNKYKNNHCNASDKENHWQKARKIVTNKFGQILIGLAETINEENHQVSSNCTDDDDIVPHEIQSIIDQAKISVDAIESSYRSYEFGNRRSREYFWHDESDSDDSNYDTYDHDFSNVTRTVRNVLESISNNINMSEFLNDSNKIKLIKTILSLVEISKKFVSLEYNLRDRFYGKHNYDSDAKEKYESVLKVLSLKWFDILLSDAVDTIDGLRSAIESSLSGIGSGLDYLCAIARNGWGHKEGALECLRRNTIEIADLDLLKDLRWLMNEPPIAKHARCMYLMKNENNNIKLVEKFALIIEEHESYARILHRRYNETKSLEFLIKAMKSVLSLKRYDIYSLNETLQFLMELQDHAFQTWAKNQDLVEKKKFEVSHIMALLIMWCTHIYRAYSLKENSPEKDSLYYILKYSYAFFSSQVENDKIGYTCTRDLGDFKNSLKWVKGIIRLIEDGCVFSDSGCVLDENPADALTSPKKWKQLCVAIMALNLIDERSASYSVHSYGNDFYTKSFHQVLSLLHNGFEICINLGKVNVSQRTATNISDEVSCIALMHYIEYSLEISPVSSDKICRTLIDEVWKISSNNFHTVPFLSFPKSLQSRLVQNKSTTWEFASLLNLAKAFPHDSSFDSSWWQIISLFLSSSEISSCRYSTCTIYPMKRRLSHFFQSTDEPNKRLIVTGLTTLFNDRPHSPQSLLLLEIILEMRINYPNSKDETKLLEDNFKASAARILKKKEPSLVGEEGDILASLFVLGETKPIFDYLTKSCHPKRAVFASIFMYFRHDGVLFCIFSEELLTQSFVSLLQKFVSFYNTTIGNEKSSYIFELSSLIALLGHAVLKSRCSSCEVLGNLIVKCIELVRVTILKLSEMDKTGVSFIINEEILTSVSRALDHNIHILAKLPEKIIRKIKVAVSNLFAVTKDEMVKHISKNCVVPLLCTALVTDIQLFADKKLSTFVSKLEIVFIHNNCEWISICEKVISKASIQLRSASDSACTTNRFAPNVKDEVQVASLLISGGALELCINTYLLQLRNLMKTSPSKIRLNTRKLSTFDKFDLKLHNPVLHQKLTCIREIKSFRIMDEIASLKLTLEKSFEVSVKDKYEDSLGVNKRSKGSSEQVQEYFNAFLFDLVHVSILSLNEMELTSQNCLNSHRLLTNLVSFWPIHNSEKDKNLDFMDVTVYSHVLKWLTCANQYWTLTQKLDFIKGIRCNLQNNCSGEGYQKARVEIESRLSQLVEFIATLLCVKLAPAKALQYLCHSSLRELTPQLSLFVNDIKSFKLFDDNETFTKLSLLVEPTCTRLWKTFFSHDGVMDFLEILLCRTSCHKYAIDALIDTDEEWTERAICVTWMSFYRVSPLTSLEYLLKKIQIKSWNRNTIAPLLITVSADLRCKREFSKTAYLDYPKDGVYHNFVQCIVAKDQIQHVWEKLRNELKEDCVMSPVQHRFISFCIDPFNSSWDSINATKEMEADLFSSLCILRKPWDRGFHNILIITLLPICLQKERYDCVEVLLQNECVTSGCDNVELVLFRFFPESDHEVISALGSVLRSDSMFRFYYEKYVIDRCLDDSFVPWKEQQVTMFVNFIHQYIPTSWLAFSAQFFVSKEVQLYVQLEKDMAKPENEHFCKAYDWESLSKRIMKALCPSGQLTTANFGTFAENWIFLYKKGTNSKSLKCSILETLSKSSSSFRMNRQIVSSKYISLMETIDMLLSKLPFLRPTDFECVMIYLDLDEGHLLEFLRKQSKNFARDIYNPELKKMILRNLFERSLHVMNITTISATRKQYFFDLLVCFSSIYKEMSISSEFKAGLERLQVTLKRKKPFLKFLSENRDKLTLD